MLKNDDAVKLPPVDPKPLAPLLPLKQEDAGRLALKAQRKERKAAREEKNKIADAAKAEAKSKADAAARERAIAVEAAKNKK